MSDLYKVGIHLAVSGNANAFFSTLGSHLLGIHRHFGKVHDDLAKTEASIGRLNRMKLAIGGGIAIVGGVEILKAAGHLESAGEKLVHAQTVLGAGLPAATRAASVLDATAAAWAEAGKNMNTTVTENVAAIQDLYNVVQDMDHAKHLLPAFNTLQVSLSSVKEGHSVGDAASAKNVASAVRAFELMGKTDTDALEAMTKDFARTTIALRGRVDGQNFLTAVQGAGDARYGWGNEFATKGFPAMVNAMGPKAGNLMNMLSNNLYGGVASSGEQANFQEKYGLHEHKDRIGKSSFTPGTVYKAALLRDNPIEWANQYREKLRGMGVAVDDLKTMQDIVAKVARGNRSVKAALDELLLPMTNRQLNKEVSNINKVGADAAGFLNDNDPKLARDALRKQFENLNTAIGAPLVQPVIDMLKSLTQVMRDLSQAAAANPGAAKMIAEGIVALGAAFTVGGIAAVIAAIGPVGWVAAGVTALVLAIEKMDPGHFKRIFADFQQIFIDIKNFDFKALVKDIGQLFSDQMKGLPTIVMTSIVSAIAELGIKLGDALKGILKNPFKGLFGDAEVQQQSFEGAGLGGASIHKASLGSANDNRPLVGSGSARALDKAGGPIPGIPSSVQMTNAERNTLGLIQKYESGGRNAPNYRYDRGHTAQGYYQITNSNWRKIAPQLGITAPNAMAATLEDQTRVAHHLLRHGGVKNWSDFNIPLRGALRRGEAAPLSAPKPVPPAKEPAPQQQQVVYLQADLHMDRERVGRQMLRFVVEKGRFPTSVGGPDTHGSWHGPGTAGTKVA